MEQARSELKATFFKDLTFRQWASQHGGVYVPVSKETRPDPYIAYLPERDVTTPSGRLLTLMSPALMVRELNDMAKQYGANLGHISSLRPLNPVNNPDPWEARALNLFESGTTEVSEISELAGKPYLRMIRVMTIGDSCLNCHSQQGYKTGDVAGGVSVSVPLFNLHQSANKKVAQIGFGHGVLWFLGIAGILTGSRKLKQSINNNELAYTALGENEARTRAILSTSLDAIITIDSMDIITDWNLQAEIIFGWSSAEVTGGRLAELIIPPQYRQQHLKGMQTYIATGSGPALSKRMEVTALRKDGSEFPVELTITPVSIGGKPAFTSFIRDISKQQKTAEQITNNFHSQRVIASVLEVSIRSIPFRQKIEQSLDIILSTPWLSSYSKGLIYIVDTKSTSLNLVAHSGIADADIKDRQIKLDECLCGKSACSPQLIFTDCVNKMRSKEYDRTQELGHYSIPINSEDKLKGVLSLYLDHEYQINEDEKNYLEAISNALGNVIQQHDNEEKLQHYAYYDELTHLPNRALFINRLSKCIKSTMRNPSYMYAVLFLDLDRFKKINDSLGHTVGNQVLMQVAKYLKQCVRDTDTVARLGGDEFSIILSDIEDIADVYRTASRIHQTLVSPIKLQHHEVFTSASIGIVHGLLTYNSHSDLLRDADIAMYRAKQKGNGHTEVFDEKMHAYAVRSLDLENELRRAVQQQEFCIYLQPIISTEQRKIIGFESLIRWINPQRGLIPPDEFIPIAEETGLINEIGLWVLDESCRLMKRWNENHPEYQSLYISVNLSPVQFLKKDLIAQIDTRLKSTALDAANLRMEITESILMENPETAEKMLRDLKTRNIRLYLDDFGTGYSSLSYLHNFPFDTLKIDRSFVSKLTTGQEHIGMVKTIIDVARNFDMDVIAEGVETREELAILNELGCHNIQGYYFSPPLPVSDAEKLLSNFKLDKP